MLAPYLAMADIAHIYRVHESTVRRWAREDAWRRTRTTPKRYHLADAQASYDKRHGGRIMAALASQYAMKGPAMARIPDSQPPTISRIEVTIRHSDGAITTFVADKPMDPDIALTFPDLLHHVPDIPPVEITVPKPLEVSVRFSAHPRHGITMNRTPASSALDKVILLDSYSDQPCPQTRAVAVRITGAKHWPATTARPQTAATAHSISRPAHGC